MRSSPPFDSSGRPTPATVAGVVDHLFRRESGRLVAILARRFGPENLHLAEDVVQDALVAAMQTWPFTGVPANPTAWILQTARNRALDQTRRKQVWQGKQTMLLSLVEDCIESARVCGAPRFEDEIKDSQLRMMLVCCHPELPAESQVAMILKVLCGFGEREIAAAFLAKEDAVTKRLVRARQFLREQNVTTELPRSSELAPRLEAVHQALYLLFNEGYKASQGDSVLREELCADAIRLGELLAAEDFPTKSQTQALLALMYLNAARMPARLDSAGVILLLANQDRTRWDKVRIRKGFEHLADSAEGPAASRYHLEAGISACHCLAASEAETDWDQILELYDQLFALDPSSVVALNRAVAVAKVKGAWEGLRAIESLPDRRSLENYLPLHAVCGHLQLEAGLPEEAASSFGRARALAVLDAEKDFLTQREAEAKSRIAQG